METRKRGNYDSGDDFVLEYGELRFTFNERDFSERCEQAGVKLGFVGGRLGDSELEDLVNLVVNGGEITYDDIDHSIAAHRPAVVLAGTGRTADAVAGAAAGRGTDARAQRLAASPLVGVSGQCIFGNVNWKPREMQGVGQDYLTVRNWPLEAGGTLSLTAGATIALYGATNGSSQGNSVNSGQEVTVLELA